MEKIVILNYTAGDVYITEFESDLESEELIQHLMDIGKIPEVKISDCSWMISKELNIHFL
jgi:hypothetical protein